MDGYDEFDAVARIKATCPIVLSIHEVKNNRNTGGNFLQADLFANKRIKEKALSLICSQFSIILQAGLPMVRAVELVAEQTTDKRLRKLLFEVASDIAGGNSLANSFAAKGNLLPTTFVETVRAGEESGTLDVSFAKLEKYFAKSSKIKQKVTSAMVYPIFLIVIAVVVVAILMIKVIPVFVDMFSSMDMQLPLVTRMLIATSNFMTHNWLILLMVIIAATLGLKLWSKTDKGAYCFSLAALKFPLTRQLTKMNAASQFANTMSTLLAAGMAMTRCLTVNSRVLNNHVISRALQDMVGPLEEGRRLYDCLNTCPYLPKLLIEMAGVGEETGSLEHTLDVIGLYFDNEVEVATERFLGMLEPIIIVGMAVMVVFVVLGFYIPMFQMYGAMA